MTTLQQSVPEIHLGDIGSVIQLTILENDLPKNISTATVKQITFKKPDNTVVDKTASFLTDGTDGKIIYTTVLNDLNQTGVWKVQGYIEMPTGKWHTNVQTFTVYTNL